MSALRLKLRKKGKAVVRNGNDILRQAASVNGGAIDTYSHVIVGLVAGREGNTKPGIWINAAGKAYLHPGHRKTLSAWLGEKKGLS